MYLYLINRKPASQFSVVAVMCAILSLFTLIFISTHLTLGFVIITPSSANDWRNSGPQLLEWQLAGFDPATFDVVLTSVDGTVNRLLATDVESSRWFTDVSPPSGGWPVGTSFNFRVNFVKDADDFSIIYASSQVFNIEAVVPVNTTTSHASVPYTPTPTSSTVSSTSSSPTSATPSSSPTSSSRSSATSATLSSSAKLTTLFSSATSVTSSSSATSAASSSGTSATPSSSATSATSFPSAISSVVTSTVSSSGARSTSTTKPAFSSPTPSSTSSTMPREINSTSTPTITSPQYSTFHISVSGTNTVPMAGSTASATVPRKVLRTRRTFR